MIFDKFLKSIQYYIPLSGASRQHDLVPQLFQKNRSQGIKNPNPSSLIEAVLIHAILYQWKIGH